MAPLVHAERPFGRTAPPDRSWASGGALFLRPLAGVPRPVARRPRGRRFARPRL